MPESAPSLPAGRIETESVQVSESRDGVVELTIASKPLGVLRTGVKRALRETLARLERESAVRCLVLTGVQAAFSVGSDIREFRQEPGWLLESELVENDLNDAIERSSLPVIAACNGHTFGGGAVLALACDMRIAAASARFGFPEVQVGAFASGGGTQRLPRLVGRGRAMDLLFTGRIIDAREALAIGLVEDVVPDAKLMERARELATRIASAPASAIGASKRCVNTGLRDGIANGMGLELRLAVETGLTEDAVEGQRAFMEKRIPRFGRP